MYIILPYWIFQYKDEMSDFLKVLVVMTGGLKDGDLKKCIISKNLRSILIVFNSPNILVSPLVVSSLQGNVEDKIQTTAHKRAISIERKKNGGELLCSMEIELPLVDTNLGLVISYILPRSVTEGFTLFYS